MPTMTGALNWTSSIGGRHTWGQGPGFDGRAPAYHDELPFHMEEVTCAIVRAMGLDWPRILSVVLSNSNMTMQFYPNNPNSSRHRDDGAPMTEVTLPEDHPALKKDARDAGAVILFVTTRSISIPLSATTSWEMFVAYTPEGKQFATYSVTMVNTVGEAVLQGLRSQIRSGDLMLSDVLKMEALVPCDRCITKVEQDEEALTFSYERY